MRAPALKPRLFLHAPIFVHGEASTLVAIAIRHSRRPRIGRDELAARVVRQRGGAIGARGVAPVAKALLELDKIRKAALTGERDVAALIDASGIEATRRVTCSP